MNFDLSEIKYTYRSGDKKTFDRAKDTKGDPWDRKEEYPSVDILLKNSASDEVKLVELSHQQWPDFLKFLMGLRQKGIPLNKGIYPVTVDMNTLIFPET